MYNFVVDAMLGNIAKWLRFLGYSTYYNSGASDEELLLQASKFKAVLITRDKELYKKALKKGVKTVYLPPLDDIEALAYLSKKVNLKLKVNLGKTRCPKCNGILVVKKPEEVKHKVPYNVLKTYNVFYVCESCGQVYWLGSHYRSMMKILREARNISEGV